MINKRGLCHLYLWSLHFYPFVINFPSSCLTNHDVNRCKQQTEIVHFNSSMPLENIFCMYEIYLIECNLTPCRFTTSFMTSFNVIVTLTLVSNKIAYPGAQNVVSSNICKPSTVFIFQKLKQILQCQERFSVVHILKQVNFILIYIKHNYIKTKK